LLVQEPQLPRGEGRLRAVASRCGRFPVRPPEVSAESHVLVTVPRMPEDSIAEYRRTSARTPAVIRRASGFDSTRVNVDPSSVQADVALNPTRAKAAADSASRTGLLDSGTRNVEYNVR